MGLNSPEYALCMVGAFKFGIIVTPISASYKPLEITRQLEMSEAKKVLIERKFLPLMLEAVKYIESKIICYDYLYKISNKKFKYLLIDIGSKILLFFILGKIEIILLDEESNDSIFATYNNLVNGPASSYTEQEQMVLDDDVLLLPYSSGTTGVPKGVMITSENLKAHILQIGVDGLGFYNPPVSGS